MVDRIVASDEQWAKLLEQYPAPAYELIRVQVVAGEVILRNPTEPEYEAFSAEKWGRSGNEGLKVAHRNAVVMQAVFPDKPTLLAWLKRWPGLPMFPDMTLAVRQLCGEAQAIQGKG